VTSETSVHTDRPIGIFDSGIGGLTVLRQIQTILPNEDLIYFADQIHVPYGPRSVEVVRDFSLAISQFLIDNGAKIIVIACNTASAAALEHLREAIPEIAFVGMEPAIKPGVVESQSGRVGVLATVGTFDSRRYASLMTRFAKEAIIFEDACPGLVEQIEKGDLDSLETHEILIRALTPMLRKDVDTLVLGCTHYPFVRPLVEEIAGPGVMIIDPSPAVARQTLRILKVQELLSSRKHPGQVTAYTTADPSEFDSLIKKLLDLPISVKEAYWSSGELRS
jgi:glutamate racemase